MDNTNKLNAGTPKADAVKATQNIDEFIAAKEDEALSRGFILTLIEHPDANETEVYLGRHGGIEQKKSDSARARLNSGEWLE
jgi:hypothetical protein